MNTIFSKSNQDQETKEGSNLQVKAFIKGDPSPFLNIDYETTKVYELTDYTLRTPLEKMDIFNELLQLEQDCELVILPVKEETTALLQDIPKDEAYEKTASLFNMLSSLKETVERDRTFLIAEGEVCGDLVDKLEGLGFTLKEKTEAELKTIELI
ncbi:hypothetical protein [Lederbergia lenta]|uniref:Uncharacterized protein n=1 Tax=Lederbergia lenta TaxID=1467 RepID=A0A2X4VM18_LEDLE|nr:hypothetical protein [Lederbergia lenta]MCM3112326.1 hypothetical protein [Lederbergia lenta]MEC2326546.1 hypothetical protein [Lederbergia lenta]SQI53197.1 Uncharacterised protein [Lederbergia lenta]